MSLKFIRSNLRREVLSSVFSLHCKDNLKLTGYANNLTYGITLHTKAACTCYWRKFLDSAIAFAEESSQSNSMVRPSPPRVLVYRDVHLHLFRRWEGNLDCGRPHGCSTLQAFSQPRDNPLPMSCPCSLERHICRSTLGDGKYWQSKYFSVLFDDRE